MTTPTNPQERFTPFLPSTFTVPEEEDRLRTFLTDKFSQISDVVNDKMIGAYTQDSESQNGTKWSYDTTKKVRNGFQAIARVTSYPNAGVLTLTNPIPDINPQFVVTDVWGSASKPCTAVGATGGGAGDYFSFYSEGNSKVTFTVNNLTIIITTTVDLTAYSGFIVIEYVRDGT